MADVIPAYIGYDPSEHDAYYVCKQSLERHSSLPVLSMGLFQDELRRSGLYSREPYRRQDDGQLVDKSDEKPFSTEFSFTRFLVPALAQYRGWSLFCDCDFLFFADVAKVWATRDDKYAVMVTKHNHNPTAAIKMHGVEQTKYPRKNWSSFVLWNNEHRANRDLTPKEVNMRPGRWLHGFEWLDDSLIGEVDLRWNYIDGLVEGSPYAYHYTEGGPWHKGYENCRYANEWREELALLQKTKS